MQFLGQVLGGHAWHDPAHDQDDLATRIARATPKGAGEQIVDFATAPTLIVLEGASMAIMRCLVRGESMTVWAMKSVGMKYLK